MKLNPENNVSSVRPERSRTALVLGGVLVGAMMSASALAQGTTPALDCEALAKLSLPHATITAVQSYGDKEYQLIRNDGGHAAPGAPAAMGGPDGPAGAGGGGALFGAPAILPAAPAFCRVSLTLKPSSDSDIRTEVWLPTENWNGKFVGVGNFGTAGAIQYQLMIEPLSKGYALAANDTGHQGGSASFALESAEKMIDYGYRANHEMTLRAKEIVEQFYGKKPSRAIWIGCSLGGIQALIEAKRYPEDYDGIIAGAPPNPLTLFNAQQIWGAWLNLNHPDGAIPASKFQMIHQAAIKACAGPAGQAQGFIDDPEHCNFKPESLLCKGAEASDCLTAAQVKRLHQLYQGPLDPRTGKVLFPGPAYGAETELMVGATKPLGPPVELYKFMVYKNPNWDWKDMDFSASVDKAAKDLDPLLRVDASELTNFVKRGKLMLWVGWTEGHNGNDLASFYKQILKNVGPAKAGNLRLFINPGMNHCGGGAGCDTFEKIDVMDQWLAGGKLPEVILSSKISGGKTIRTRPLCAYPAVAKYKGKGSLDDADSFACVRPLPKTQ